MAIAFEIKRKYSTKLAGLSIIFKDVLILKKLTIHDSLSVNRFFCSQ